MCEGVKKALWTKDGIKEGGIIEKVERKNDQLIFSIEAWVTRLCPIQTKGCSIAEPVLVKEYLYVEASYLPELLFSSNEQRQLWMMLKGISNDIEVKLNNDEINQKSRIYFFEVNNHKFIWILDCLIHVYDGLIEEVKLDYLKQNSYKTLSELAEKIKEQRQ